MQEKLSLRNALLRSLTLSALLGVLACSPAASAPPDACSGAEVCGDYRDCYALCANVERLGCAEKWHVDKSDGFCLDLCLNAVPGLCPALGAVQQSCEDIERVSECGK
jgi:hypothetical protein